MTHAERQITRAIVAERDGYRPRSVPESPEWAGYRLPAATDEAAHRATLALRGIDPDKKESI